MPKIRRRLSVRIHGRRQQGDQKEKYSRPSGTVSCGWNMALSLLPYRFDATFHQSPLNAGNSPWKNFLNIGPAQPGGNLVRLPVSLLPLPAVIVRKKRIGSEPCWKRSESSPTWRVPMPAAFFEMAPRSIVARLTPSLVAGFDSYGLTSRELSGSWRASRRRDCPATNSGSAGELVRTHAAGAKGTAG
jgi:CRISPR-associated protein Cst2